MMQTSTSAKNAGLVVSAYTFFSYFAQSFAPPFYGKIANMLSASTNPRMYGYVVCMAAVVGSLTSNIFYWKAGKAYGDVMRKKERGEAIDDEEDE